MTSAAAPGSEGGGSEAGLHLDYDTWVGLTSLDDLLTRFRAAGATGDDEAVLTAAQADWRRASLERAREPGAVPERLEPVTRTLDGVTYEVYGVVHGMVGGESRDYKQFCDAAVGELEPALFENGLSYFYPRKGAFADIPDFWVLGVGGSLRVGLYVGFRFFELVWELLRDALRLGGQAPDDGPLEAVVCSPRYHAIDPEARRGLDEYPPLPSRLQIDYELAGWARAGKLAGWRYPTAIVPRSLYMAAFAAGYAGARGLQRVALVVGDLHTMEIVRFLEAPPRDHPVWRQGEAFGRRDDGARVRGARLRKLAHLGVAAAAGLVGLLPALAVLWLVLLWTGGQ